MLDKPTDAMIEAVEAWNAVHAGMRRFGMESDAIDTLAEFFATLTPATPASSGFEAAILAYNYLTLAGGKLPVAEIGHPSVAVVKAALDEFIGEQALAMKALDATLIPDPVQSDGEALGEALFFLSDSLRKIGALESDNVHAAYERVVAEFTRLTSLSTPVEKDNSKGVPEPWLVRETEGPFSNYDICLPQDPGAKACAVIATVFGNRAVADEIAAAHNAGLTRLTSLSAPVEKD